MEKEKKGKISTYEVLPPHAPAAEKASWMDKLNYLQSHVEQGPLIFLEPKRRRHWHADETDRLAQASECAVTYHLSLGRRGDFVAHTTILNPID